GGDAQGDGNERVHERQAERMPEHAVLCEEPIIREPDEAGRRDDVVASEGKVDAREKRIEREDEEPDEPRAHERIADELPPKGTAHVRSPIHTTGHRRTSIHGGASGFFLKNDTSSIHTSQVPAW